MSSSRGRRIAPDERRHQRERADERENPRDRYEDERAARVAARAAAGGRLTSELASLHPSGQRGGRRACARRDLGTDQLLADGVPARERARPRGGVGVRRAGLKPSLSRRRAADLAPHRLLRNRRGLEVGRGDRECGAGGEHALVPLAGVVEARDPQRREHRQCDGQTHQRKAERASDR